MRPTLCLAILCAGVLVGSGAHLARAQEPGEAAVDGGAARPDFDPTDTIAWAAPTESDLLHRTVSWHDAVIDGVLDAQAQDKPLLLWLYFGGPLDDC